MKFQGIPYIWGGENPNIGFDCSGFVIWVLQVFELLPSGDWTAEGLRQKFPAISTPNIGDLVFYGKPDRATHVMMCIADGIVIGASGGNSECTTPEIAKKKNAMVKIKRINYRDDIIGYASVGIN